MKKKFIIESLYKKIKKAQEYGDKFIYISIMDRCELRYVPFWLIDSFDSLYCEYTIRLTKRFIKKIEKLYNK